MKKLVILIAIVLTLSLINEFYKSNNANAYPIVPSSSPTPIPQVTTPTETPTPTIVTVTLTPTPTITKPSIAPIRIRHED